MVGTMTALLLYLVHRLRRWFMRRRKTQAEIDEGWQLSIDDEPTVRSFPPAGLIPVEEWPGVERIQVDGRWYMVGRDGLN